MNTDVSPTHRTDPLWLQLEQFQVDPPGVSLPFVARLARENGWTLAYAGRVWVEYLRFLFLSRRAGHPVSPSPDVDQAWHLHLVYTRSYWADLCGAVLGKPLHHEPTRGGREEGAKFTDWYTRTLESYRLSFGASAPSDIWPAASACFVPGPDSRWVNPRTHWILPKPHRTWFSRVSKPSRLWTTLLAAGPATAASAADPRAADTVLNWNGPAFLGLYALLYGCTLAVALVYRARCRRALERVADSGAEPRIDHPFELAFLAGGPPRALQTAILALWKTGWVATVRESPKASPRWVAREGAEPLAEHLRPAWSRLQEAGDKGLETPELLDRTSDLFRPHELALAVKGLRPTAEESASISKRSTRFFYPLLVLGGVKLLLGMARDKPVGFLFGFLFVTVFTLIVLQGKRCLITRRGKALLDRLRQRHPDHELRKKSEAPAGPDWTLPASLAGFALYGTTFASDVPDAASLATLRKHTDSWSSSGSGCSSGCATTSSSSDSGGDGGGDGGGGCGGCGGD